jgi:hypothetical protein
LSRSKIAEQMRDIYDAIRHYFKTYFWNPILYRTTRRYHIIDLRDGGNGYGVGWHDTDTRIFQACFMLLKEYVEKEEPFRMIDWDHCEKDRLIGEEIKFLYDWWTVERAKKRAAVAEEWKGAEEAKFLPREGGGYTFHISDKSRELLKKDDQLDAEDDEMLLRLIKIRHHLWT